MSAAGLGPEMCESYFLTLKQFITARLSKIDFEDSLRKILPPDKISEHNKLIKDILRAAHEKRDGVRDLPTLVPGKKEKPEKKKSLVAQNRVPPTVGRKKADGAEVGGPGAETSADRADELPDAKIKSPGQTIAKKKSDRSKAVAPPKLGAQPPPVEQPGVRADGVAPGAKPQKSFPSQPRGAAARHAKGGAAAAGGPAQVLPPSQPGTLAGPGPPSAAAAARAAGPGAAARQRAQPGADAAAAQRVTKLPISRNAKELFLLLQAKAAAQNRTLGAAGANAQALGVEARQGGRFQPGMNRKRPGVDAAVRPGVKRAKTGAVASSEVYRQQRELDEKRKRDLLAKSRELDGPAMASSTPIVPPGAAAAAPSAPSAPALTSPRPPVMPLTMGPPARAPPTAAASKQGATPVARPGDLPPHQGIPFFPLHPGHDLDLELFYKVRARLRKRVVNEHMGMTHVSDEAAALLTHALELHIKQLLEVSSRKRANRVGDHMLHDARGYGSRVDPIDLCDAVAGNPGRMLGEDMPVDLERLLLALY
eukprot:CAMPEP_0198725120 /NCGR_PEP_ID=MMETSP1475-20131203/2491_1 /TAXON_ID= ORGANISM="Unidentified sp., Strain CCMP1999" /NCGR_SAMPLE_ID=MMETSP1475 /ASSEMBLY_ACC=CAM_ASM_001111 /LENGTH=536 /DNA_ID=CAMNT_0044486829 /DNA_START=229 /DNA_END=1839 /DNA_ORIENTATION=+